MKSILLTSIPLNYADSIRFEHDGQISRVVIVNEEQKLLVTMCGIINFSVSNNGSSENDDYLDFIDIQHEYREINSSDLQKFGFSSSRMDSDNLVNIISIYGTVALQVICKTVEISSTTS
jgi:hypothetical protein